MLRRSRWSWSLVLAVVASQILLLLGAWLLFQVSQPRPELGAPSKLVVPRPPALRTVQVSIAASPEEARIFLDGVRVTNPYQTTLELTPTLHDIRATCPGYDDHVLRDVDFALTPMVQMHFVDESARLPVPVPVRGAAAR
jgi:hypothetical protein